jgi:restriction system protein
MAIARDEEERKHREARAAELQSLRRRRDELEVIRNDLFRLFSETDPHRRGKDLEGVLNRMFNASDILIRETFVVANFEGDGVIEQIDGAIELDGRLYLVEMKWWNKKLGRAEVASHLVSVYGRGEAGGVFISASGFLQSAIEDYTAALGQRTVVMVELQELVDLLTREGSLVDLLRMKIREATLAKRPLVFLADSG